MILNTFLPKVLALIASFEKELHGIFVITLKQQIISVICYTFDSFDGIDTHVALGM